MWLGKITRGEAKLSLKKKIFPNVVGKRSNTFNGERSNHPIIPFDHLNFTIINIDEKKINLAPAISLRESVKLTKKKLSSDNLEYYTAKFA